MDQTDIELSLRSYLLNPLRHWTKYPFFIRVVPSVTESAIRDRVGKQGKRTATHSNYQAIVEPGESDPEAVGIYITDVRPNEVATLFSKILMNVEYGIIIDFDSFANVQNERNDTLILAQDIANAFYKYNNLDIIQPAYLDENNTLVSHKDMFDRPDMDLDAGIDFYGHSYISDINSGYRSGYRVEKLGETRLVRTGDNQFPIDRSSPGQYFLLYREPIYSMDYDIGQRFRYKIVDPFNLNNVYTAESNRGNDDEKVKVNKVTVLNLDYIPGDPVNPEYVTQDIGFLEDQTGNLVIAAYDENAVGNERKVFYFKPVIEHLFNANQAIEVRDTVYVFIDQDDPGAEVRNTIGLRITDADTTSYNVRRIDTREKIDFTDILPSTETIMALTRDEANQLITDRLAAFKTDLITELDGRYAELSGATFTGQVTGQEPASNKAFVTRNYVDTHQGVATKTFTGYVAWSSDIAFTAAEFKAGTSFTDALAAAIPAQSGFAYLGQWFIGDEWSDISEVHIDYGQNMFDELSEAVNLTIDGVAGKYRRIAVKLAGTVVGGEILRWRS